MAHDPKLTLALGATVALVVVAYYILKGFGTAASDSGSSSVKLSPNEIAGYAHGAGFSGDDLVVAVAVALAESGGNTGVVGDLALTPGGSIGLWQINLKYHPEFAGSDLTDPAANAAAAFSIYSAAGNSFNPWSTYKNEAYGKYINTASDAVSA